MNRRAGLKLAFNTLFVKLMVSFLCVIILLVSCNLFAYIYLSQKLYNEIVRYNELGMKQTVESYENQFRMTQTMLISLMRSDRWNVKLEILNRVKENKRYDIIPEVKEDLSALYSNPFLHLNNFILVFRKAGYVLEKDGTSSIEDMFDKYYSSNVYPPHYWIEASIGHSFMQVLPVAEFYEKTMGQARPMGPLMPILFKAAPYGDVYGLLLVNPQQLYSAFGRSGDSSFYMMDQNGNILFASAPSKEMRVPASLQEETFHERNGNFYYFYKKGADTGFTYVRVVPIASISSEMMKLNVLLVSLLSAAVVVGVVTSVLFSLRLNNPLRRIIEMLERNSASTLPTSSIREYAILSDRMSRILQMNELIRTDLDRKNTLVQQFAYTNKVKNIPMNPNLADREELVQSDRPYVAVLYEIAFKNPEREYEAEMLLLRKLIHNLISSRDGVTLQIEQNRFMSFIFDPGSRSEILHTLDTLKQLLRADDYLYLTIAASPVYTAKTSFTEAYGQLSSMLKERRLNGDTQIITGPGASLPNSYRLKLTTGEDLLTLLLTGNENAVFEWIDRHLELLKRKDAAVGEFQAFARGAADQVEKTFAKLNMLALTEKLLPSSFDALSRFYSVKQYQDWFRELIRPALAAIAEKNETKDPIASFVLEYMEAHFCEDMNLDSIADKLNLTPGYLSGYFKEKTGINFSDHLNELRIHRAKELLMNLELRIQDVASYVGYQNVNSFIRMFKRCSGVTPGEYRKRLPASARGSSATNLLT
ncbi:AraC family transcriptional regulator [Cohnella sp. REN36]|uniref:helix-turn-helix domain-containing protein n=1 Tax=Cohnella sp. REN36 TaxID=2887347 RepID=UPI001D1417F1|nr:helix-turn-helix domain-containing protein [Cohnella sp. REN36]MCC3373614.1 helix-turn-helix domain-containing protein [Cohnella sp. REN36]